MIRVLVAEDMRILRDTLVAVLGLETDIEVVAQVADGDAIVPSALAQRPDVAVVDIDLPGTDGLTAAAQLREQQPDCQVLILTVLGRPGNLLGTGRRVAGFLPKETPAGDLVHAVRRVAAGEKVIDPHLAVAALEVAEIRCRRGRWRCCGGAPAAPDRPRSPPRCSCRTARSATTWPRRSPSWGRAPGRRGPDRRRGRLAVARKPRRRRPVRADCTSPPCGLHGWFMRGGGYVTAPGWPRLDRMDGLP